MATRKRKEFDDRLNELTVDNDTAFRVVTRTTKDGIAPPRLAYMRKFWDGLESMSQYWDCSLDQYFESTVPDPQDVSRKKGSKRARLDSGASVDGLSATESDVEEECSVRNVEDDPGKQNPKDSKQSAHPQPDSSLPEAQEAAFQAEHELGHCPVSIFAAPSVRTLPRYKGRRTSNGRNMPDSFRTETVKGFVEGTVWPFGAQISPPRRMPLVQINKLNLPIRQTAMVARVPKDRTKARQGYIEGPILGIQVRADTDFRNEKDELIPEKSRLDLMRELGGLLQLAQERKREGKVEVKPGEGKWWTEKPRWGGGPGGEVGAEEGNAEVVAAVEEAATAATKLEKKPSPRDRRRRTPALLWKELKCGSGYWDPKTDYIAVGRDSSAKVDEVGLFLSPSH